MKVVWKAGYSPKNVSAQTAYDVIQDLNRNGKSGPKELVDASRSEDAPLHSLFEWNDSVAAERFRESQAVTIINHVLLIPEEHEPEMMPIRAFMQVDHRSGEYEPTMEIMQIPEKREKLIDIAKREMQSFISKYQTLVELKKVVDAMNSFLNGGDIA